VVERGGTELPSWITSHPVDRCDNDDSHVTGAWSRDGCGRGLLLEGVASLQQAGERYELVVMEGQCDSETDAWEEAFFVHVLAGIGYRVVQK